MGYFTFLATISVPAVKTRAFVRLVAYAAVHTGLVAYRCNVREKTKSRELESGKSKSFKFHGQQPVLILSPLKESSEIREETFCDPDWLHLNLDSQSGTLYTPLVLRHQNVIFLLKSWTSLSALKWLIGPKRDVCFFIFNSR